MPNRVIETVTFKLNEGVSREEFARMAEKMNTYFTGCPGFISRRLSCTEDGTWIEHIEWRDIDAAKAAAAGIGNDPANAPALSAINGPTVTMMHSDLAVSVN